MNIIDSAGGTLRLAVAGTGVGGYFMAGAKGEWTTLGSAEVDLQSSGLALHQPVVGMAATPFGLWLVASDGGVFTAGSAGFYGSTGNVHLAKPVVGMAATPDGKGYWLVASDGGIFTFGDAHFLAHRQRPPGQAHRSAWPPAPTGQAIGWWRPTAESSPSMSPSKAASGAEESMMSSEWLQPQPLSLHSCWPPPAQQGHKPAGTPLAGRHHGLIK